MSDDRKHDSAFALAAIKLITDECIKLTADVKNNITIISDGAASHFKNRFQFYELGRELHEVKWIFSATGIEKVNAMASVAY